NFFPGALPLVPERTGWHWLPCVTLGVLLVELAARGPRVPAPAGWLLRALAAGHAAWLLVPAGLRDEKVWAVPAFAAAVFVEWAALELVARKQPHGTLPLAAGLACFGAAAVLIHAHVARFTDVATFLSASLVGVAAVAWWRRADVGAALPAMAVVLPGLLLSAYYETAH